MAMISVPVSGCCDSNRARKASAGGQLEHPSEVNSSTRTGVRAPPGRSEADGREPIGTRAIRQAARDAATQRRPAITMNVASFRYLGYSKATKVAPEMREFVAVLWITFVIALTG